MKERMNEKTKKVNDEIRHVNGVSVADKSVHQMKNLIVGPPGRLRV
jgi:C-terminal processing protease CtpA/Prc